MGQTSFLGKGVSFPFGTTNNGEVKFSSYEKNVEESIHIILSTKLGERLMRPDLVVGFMS